MSPLVTSPVTTGGDAECLQQGARPVGEWTGEERVKAVLQGRCHRGRDLEDRPHHRGEDEGPAEPVEHDPVEPVGGGAPHLRGPGHRVLDGRVNPAEALVGGVEVVKPPRTRTRPGRHGREHASHLGRQARRAGPPAGVEAHDRSAQDIGKGWLVDADAPTSRDVEHGQGDNDPHLQLPQLRGQVKAPGQMGGVGDDDHDIGPLARGHVDDQRSGELFVGRQGVEGVGTRQVDQFVCRPARAARPPDAATNFDGGARPVAHGAPGAGEGVEQGGLADVRGAGESHDRRARRRDSRCGVRVARRNAGEGGGGTRSAGLGTHPASFPAGLLTSGAWTRMAATDSRSRARRSSATATTSPPPGVRCSGVRLTPVRTPSWASRRPVAGPA